MAMKEQPIKTDTTCLRSSTQNIRFLTSISAVILKLKVQITSIFFKRYFYLCNLLLISLSWPKAIGPGLWRFFYTLPCCYDQSKITPRLTIVVPLAAGYTNEKFIKRLARINESFVFIPYLVDPRFIYTKHLVQLCPPRDFMQIN